MRFLMMSEIEDGEILSDEGEDVTKTAVIKYLFYFRNYIGQMRPCSHLQALV